MLKLSGVPLAAPSANAFGYVSPTTAAHVQAGLGHKIRHILDGGPCAIGLESTIVDLRDPRKPRLLRPGAITRAQLEHVLGCRLPVAVADRRTSRGAQLAPGLLKRHYSPRTPVVLHTQIKIQDVLADRQQREGWLFIARPATRSGRVGRPSLPSKDRNVFWLDDRGDLRGAARKLFSQLRAIDTRGFKKIHVELAAGTGLAEAINDRLRRAAARG